MMTRMLRPGMLVSLKTSVKGGVKYDRETLEQSHATEEGTLRAKWETTKEVENPEEFELAQKIRGKCRSLITGICAQSDFGLLCPSNRVKDLEAAIEQARGISEQFNLVATRSTVSFYIITGQVAVDDVEATRAIAAEVRGLMDAMEQGVKAADVEAIRAAANKARNLGSMLSDEAGQRVKEAVEQARAVASKIARSGDEAAKVVAEIRLDAVEKARFAFLDFDEMKAGDALAVEARGLDLMPAEAATTHTDTAPTPQIEV